eukprot:gnl/Hemi2/23999_TR8046_c2_g1_i1.p1 gnl/Hemi2/23999_TR8046_c2_g1~~gnl/Hemi2/23999_TR8046_c2_g1_i1.p1  ORF type:complete len:342 (-),score=72.44 gnl/Hemi2/23999_TR8046_c2_g1_i1:47-982(-)
MNVCAKHHTLPATPLLPDAPAGIREAYFPSSTAARTRGTVYFGWEKILLHGLLKCRGVVLSHTGAGWCTAAEASSHAKPALPRSLTPLLAMNLPTPAQTHCRMSARDAFVTSLKMAFCLKLQAPYPPIELPKGMVVARLEENVWALEPGTESGEAQFRIHGDGYLYFRQKDDPQPEAVDPDESVPQHVYLQYKQSFGTFLKGATIDLTEEVASHCPLSVCAFKPAYCLSLVDLHDPLFTFNEIKISIGSQGRTFCTGDRKVWVAWATLLTDFLHCLAPPPLTEDRDSLHRVMASKPKSLSDQEEEDARSRR